jgi:N-acylglucosamine 2-epimerase
MYRDILQNDVLKFWLDHSFDWKNGGVYTQIDRAGNVYGTEKSVWFQGRTLWVFAKAYNFIEKRPEYLEAAKMIYEFLNKCVDEDGRMFFLVTEEGKYLQKRRYYFSETFAAIGCAELYKATGDKEHLEAAERYFQVAYECFTGKRKLEPKFNPEERQMKALSPVMIMLATAQVLRSVEEVADKYNALAKEFLDEILHGGFLKENALHESVATDGSFVDSPTGRHINPGHSLEAAWFVLVEGLITENQEAIDAAKKIIDITLPLGLVDDSILSFVDVCGKPSVALEWDMKLWWPQCEAIIALRLAGEVFEDENYLKIADAIYNYTEKHFRDKEYGEWYGYLRYDRTVSSTLKGNIYKGCFHVPRLYMILDAMQEKGGILNYMK